MQMLIILFVFINRDCKCVDSIQQHVQTAEEYPIINYVRYTATQRLKSYTHRPVISVYVSSCWRIWKFLQRFVTETNCTDGRSQSLYQSTV